MGDFRTGSIFSVLKAGSCKAESLRSPLWWQCRGWVMGEGLEAREQLIWQHKSLASRAPESHFSAWSLPSILYCSPMFYDVNSARCLLLASAVHMALYLTPPANGMGILLSPHFWVKNKEPAYKLSNLPKVKQLTSHGGPEA